MFSLDVTNLLILMFAGLLAGVVTGLVSASAAVIVTPILSIGLGMDIYAALGISLAADVVASLTTSYVYWKHDKVKIKEPVLLIVAAVIFVFVGSFFTQDVSNLFLGLMSGVGICILALQFFKGSFEERLSKIREKSFMKHMVNYPKLFMIVAGSIIGLNTGIMGAGGGVLILFVLILGKQMKLKTAIGTSAFTMSIIALTGAIAHFLYGDYTIIQIVTVSIGSFIGAIVSSLYVQKSEENHISKLAGIVFSLIGVTMVINQFI